MTKLRARRWLILAISALAALILQVITLIRHVRQQPGEWPATAVLSLIAAALAFAVVWSVIGWMRLRSGRAPTQTRDERRRGR